MDEPNKHRTESLRETEVDADPVVQFGRWHEEWRHGEPTAPLPLALATATADGYPSARMVLLKGFDEQGFVFFTNYESRKAFEIASNPRAAMVFYFQDQHRQVRVEGVVEKISERDSDTYFATRERGSQISAVVSKQGAVLNSRVELDARVRELERQFEGRPIPRPSYWGGYRLRPKVFEFWQGRPNRLHDRLRYTRLEDGTWVIERLAP